MAIASSMGVGAVLEQVRRLWCVLVESRASVQRDSEGLLGHGLWDEAVLPLPSWQIVQACHRPCPITVAVSTKDGGPTLPMVLGHLGI